jgi:diguanylate cyclase (GGDEF)-like protein
VLNQIVAEANAAGLCQGAFASRYGGEEFAVVIPKASKDACMSIAQQIIEGIRMLAIPHENNADFGIVTASIGGEYLDAPNNKIATVFCAADARLYQAKEQGRNRAELNAPI